VPGGEVLGLKLDPVDAALAELLDLPKAAGLVVRSVTPGSSAETAGLKKRDVLLRAGDAELNDLEKLRAATAKGGGELKVEIWRNGAAQTFVLALPAPSSTPGNAVNPVAAAASAVWIGLEIENFRDDVRVNTVIPGSPAARAGFRSDDRLKTLDGEEVLDNAMFVRAVSSGATGKARRIDVARGDDRLTFELLPEPKPTNEQLFARIKKLAEAGDHDAEHRLAMMYVAGQGIPDPDAVTARRWLRAAAEAGVPVAQSGYGEFLLNGTGGEKNPTEGIEWIKKAAEQSWSNAFLSLGQIYYHGLGVEKHEAEARHWFGLALKQGSLKALVNMGQFYENGILYEKDLQKAAEFYRTAAHRGNLAAETEWGRCLLNGIGVEQDHQAAVRWFRTASDAGDPNGHFQLANMYSHGQGVAQDREAAVNLYRKAAALGHDKAMFNLGFSFATGLGVPADHVEAYRWFRAAADLGQVDAYTELGFLNQQGRGVPQSDEQAVAWYRKAAEAGHAQGQYNLSVMLSDGRGIEKNDKEAMKWCHKAALQKVPAAECEMGVIAMEGRGVKKDLDTALAWFKAAANHGNARAQHNLGASYEYGWGTVAPNQSEAIKWYERAAAQNFTESIDALKRLGRR
jgi:TPR repeat protein